MEWILGDPGTREVTEKVSEKATSGWSGISGQLEPSNLISVTEFQVKGAVYERCCLYLFCRLVQAASATYLLQSLGKALNSVTLLNSQKNDGPAPHPPPMQPHRSSETFTGQSLCLFSVHQLTWLLPHSTYHTLLAAWAEHGTRGLICLPLPFSLTSPPQS